jgi:hypothetical protein
MAVGTWCDAGEDQVQKERVKYVGMLMRQDLTVSPRKNQNVLLKCVLGGLKHRAAHSNQVGLAKGNE